MSGNPLLRSPHRLLTTLACITLGFVVQVRAADAPIAASPVLEDRYPRQPVMFGDDVESFADLVYSVQTGYRPLILDLYKPRAKAPASGYPLVVYIHGGGWQSGHTRQSGAFANWPGVLASIAAKGYVVVSVEYRLSKEAPFPAALQDVKSAIRWVRANAQTYSVDKTRAVVWGGSAGGQLAALVATTCGVAALAPADPGTESDCVQGFIAWYGMFDLSGNMSDTLAQYLHCAASGCTAQQLAAASATTYLDAKDPPALLIHGELDKVVPVQQSRSFSAALQAKAVPVKLSVIPGVDHSFVGATPEATRTASLMALSQSIAFIEATLGGKQQ
jgi:acetyl esterase/lipase